MNKNKLNNSYDDSIVRYFSLATIVWAGVAFLIGLWAALQIQDLSDLTSVVYVRCIRTRPSLRLRGMPSLPVYIILRNGFYVPDYFRML